MATVSLVFDEGIIVVHASPGRTCRQVSEASRAIDDGDLVKIVAEAHVRLQLLEGT